MTPFVSIVMPIYNGSTYLSRSISSVLDQTFKDWELIVVDDGSDDDLQTAIDPFLSDLRISFVSQPHLGVHRAKNYGVSLAKGNYVCFLDVDDAYLSTYIYDRVLLFADGGVDVIHGGVSVIGSPRFIDKDDSSVFRHISEVIVCSTLFGKRGVFLQYPFSVDYAEGSVFLSDISSDLSVKKTDIIGYIYYRDNTLSITNRLLVA